MVLQNFISNCFYGTKRITDLNQICIRKINNVTVKDMEEVGATYISKLFSTAARTAIVCHPDKAAEISTEFKE